MDNSDIYRKSSLGREELKNKNIEMLPREARTLLIMIDGKKTYEHYLTVLDNSKMFLETGGIAPLFELLQAMELIEYVEKEQNPADTLKPAPSQSPIFDTTTSPQASQMQASDALQPEPIEQTVPQSLASTLYNFDKTFDTPKLDKAKSAMGNFFKSKPTGANYRSIKSDVEAFIEENASPQDAWGYLLSLRQCNNEAQLLAFVEKIDGFANDDVSYDMSKFVDAIKNQ